MKNNGVKNEHKINTCEKTYNVSASDVNTQSGRDYRIAIVNSGHARN